MYKDHFDIMSCSKYVWVKTAKRRQPAGSHNDGATTVGAGTDVDAENFKGAQPFVSYGLLGLGVIALDKCYLIPETGK